MDDIRQRLKDGELVAFLGLGVFKNLTCKDGSQLPYDSDSMILSLNNGRAMSPRLMYEYSRAAMSLEQRKGREYLVAMTNHIYASKEYEPPFAYEFFKDIQPKYLIDTNLDDSACKIYEDVEHFMITGISRIMAEYDRFVVYLYDVKNKEYKQINKDELNTDLPILFKPMGCMIPNKDFIISDADFVDWLTEAMGGFCMPKLLKEYRKGKSYLFLGVDFSRDTFRMVANEISMDLKEGYILSEKDEYSKKEAQFAKNHNLEFIKDDVDSFLKALL